MKPRSVATAVIGVMTAAAWIVFARGGSPPRELGSAPVVVELFTSQGCSSCPPADELLREMRRDPVLQKGVIPIAFHVDYWDYLGWRDPFSSRAWSERQEQYVQTMGLESAYTPQAVINGSRQMVGSNARAVYAAIEEESHRKPSATVGLEFEGDTAIVKANPSRPKRDLLVIVYENGVTTRIGRGENAGRTLVNDAIVRRLVRFPIDGPSEQRVELKIERSWNRHNLGVAALVQDRSSMRIEAAVQRLAP